jgi:apolipoprotein N-acyltransferase
MTQMNTPPGKTGRFKRRSDPEMGVLLARVPLDRGSKTIYASCGDAFGWMCVVAWAALLALRLGWFRKLSGRRNP